MDKRTKVFLAIQAALLASSSTLAESTDSQTKPTKTTVTGSHIKSSKHDIASPILIFDREDITRSGLTNLGDFLRQLPSAGASANLQDNNGGNGSIEMNLRNIGSNKTLVLVNGKRWNTSIEGATDFTTIPISIVERVEVLHGGASAIYGSDAIAGVINIITRSKYEGVEVKGQYGKSAEPDGAQQAFNVSMGAASDRGSVFFDASYVKTEPVWAGDREISKNPRFGTGNTGGSSGTPQGRFITYDQDGNWANVTTTPGSNGYNTPNDPDLIPWGSDTLFNFAPDNYLLTPQELTALYIQGRYQITDNVSVSSEALYNRRESAQFLAPTPLFIGDWGRDYGASQTPIGIGGQNPYNPFGYDLDIGYDTSGGLIFLGRRMVEQGNRKFQQTNDTYYYNFGLEGFLDIGTGWDWSASYSFNQNDELTVTKGHFNMDNVRQALSNACLTDANCVPLNLFGGAGTITQDMLDYISFIGHSNNQSKLLTYKAFASTELIELPAGPLGFAIGYEHRRHFGSSQPDALIASGVTSADIHLPYEGRQSSKEVFTELNIPLLNDSSGRRVLGANLAARYSDYDTFGSQTSSKFDLKWKPFEDLLIRASFSESFRAPSLFEMFEAERDIYPIFADPCSGGEEGNPGLPGCIGIPSNFQHALIFGFTSGGNSNLKPEEADSFTVGLVYEPSTTNNLVFEFDYYDIQIDNVVTTIGAGQIANACAISGTLFCDKITRGSSGAVQELLDVNVNADQLEVSGLDFVISYTMDTDYGLFGFNLDTSYILDYTTSTLDAIATAQNGTTTFVEFDSFDSSGGPNSVGRTLFEVRSNLGVNWSYGDWSVFYQARYIGDYEEACDPRLNEQIVEADVPEGFQWCQYASDGLNRDGSPSNPNGNLDRRHIGSVTYHDIQGQYHLADNDTTLSLGIQNLFDKTPPLSPLAFANSFNPAYYDGIGQRWYFSVTKQF